MDELLLQPPSQETHRDHNKNGGRDNQTAKKSMTLQNAQPKSRINNQNQSNVNPISHHYSSVHLPSQISMQSFQITQYDVLDTQSRSPSVGRRSVQRAKRDKDGKFVSPSKIVNQKLSRLQLDPALPLEQQLELQLALPELTNTDVLMIKMKHSNQVKVTERRNAQDEIFNQISEKKRVEKEKLAALKG